jgi:hypothetical protein
VSCRCTCFSNNLAFHSTGSHVVLNYKIMIVLAMWIPLLLLSVDAKWKICEHFVTGNSL